MIHRERMSSVDTTWLRMDRPNNLMMIVGVWMLEGPVDARSGRDSRSSTGCSATAATVSSSSARPPESSGATIPTSTSPPHPSHPPAGTRRQTCARAPRRRARLRAARPQPPALDRARRREIRGRRRGDLPHASRHRRRHGADGGDDEARRRPHRQAAEAPRPSTKRKAGCRACWRPSSPRSTRAPRLELRR